jgi:hypothetical protein
MLLTFTENMSLEELAQAIELLAGNKTVRAIQQGQLFLVARARFAASEDFWDWALPKFGLRLGRSTIYSYMDLARCVTTDNYPRNFKLSALCEWAAPKYEAIRDEILSLLKDKERVNKQDVIEAAAMILFGGPVESADDSRESQTSQTASSSPILSIRRGRQKARRYDLESASDVQALIRFVAELAAEYHDAAVVAEWNLDADERAALIGMDLAEDDGAGEDSPLPLASEHPTASDVPEMPRPRITPRQVPTRRNRIQPRPVESWLDNIIRWPKPPTSG